MEKYIAISAIDERIVAKNNDYFDLMNDHICFLDAKYTKNQSRPGIVWIFMNQRTKEYMAIPETDISDRLRWLLELQDYELYSDNVQISQVKEYMELMEPAAKTLKFIVKPLSFREAKDYINTYHRHHKSPQGHKFLIGIYDQNDSLIGVAIAGRPVSRYLDDGETLEVTRCCVQEGFKNAVSKLYSAVISAAKAMGYKQIITYTLMTENGSSMKAVGFKLDKLTAGGSWNSPSRPRTNRHPTIPKHRWSKVIN